MPIYEYQCRKCNAHIEAMQKITDKPLTKCRKCGGRLEKQWSSTSFQFKGSGWYVTDYAGKKADGGKEEKASAASESKTPKSETKDTTAPVKEAAPAKKATEKKNASSNQGER